MPKDLPLYISLAFILTTLLTYILFILAVKKFNSSKTTITVAIVLAVWLLFTAIMSFQKFFLVTDTFPPRLALAVGPMLLAIIILFITKGGKKFVDSLSPYILTQLHFVRLFVEIILLLLFINKLVPKIMTFEGRNFDILAGLSAPFIGYYGFIKPRLSKGLILAWNLFAMLLLFNIVVIAMLSAPFTFQQLAFDQPNIAVLYFPFVWLPGFIVPLVLFSHLVMIRRLTKKTLP